jgi:hypothetical protein
MMSMIGRVKWQPAFLEALGEPIATFVEHLLLE